MTNYYYNDFIKRLAELGILQDVHYTITDSKDNLRKARKYDLNAKKAIVVSSLKENIRKMDGIINRYFVNNKDYDSLKLSVDSLKNSIDLVDLDNVSISEVNKSKADYNKLKTKMRAYASNEVSTE
jgi:hypothetical protein